MLRKIIKSAVIFCLIITLGVGCMDTLGFGVKTIEDVEKGMLKYLEKKYDEKFYIDEIGTPSISSTAILALARSERYPEERVRVHYFKDGKIPYQDNYAGVLVSQEVLELVRPGIEAQYPNCKIEVSFQTNTISPKLGKGTTYKKFMEENDELPATIGIYTPYYPEEDNNSKVMALANSILEKQLYSWVSVNFLENNDMEWIYNTPLSEVKRAGTAAIRHYSSFYVRYKDLEDGTTIMHIDRMNLDGEAIQMWEDITKKPDKSEEVD